MAEALSSGVPVAATDHGGSPEMLAELPPSAGVLIPPGDPSALAAALIRLVPSGRSSAASRRQRVPMRLRQTTTFAELFEQARLSGAQRDRASATSS
jgi:glycosyltransferase involved in cell wall biosynthesis